MTGKPGRSGSGGAREGAGRPRQRFVLHLDRIYVIQVAEGDQVEPLRRARCIAVGAGEAILALDDGAEIRILR